MLLQRGVAVYWDDKAKEKRQSRDYLIIPSQILTAQLAYLQQLPVSVLEDHCSSAMTSSFPFLLSFPLLSCDLHLLPALNQYAIAFSFFLSPLNFACNYLLRKAERRPMNSLSYSILYESFNFSDRIINGHGYVYTQRLSSILINSPLRRTEISHLHARYIICRIYAQACESCQSVEDCLV